MISDWVAKYTHTTTLFTHEQYKSSDYDEVIFVHVGVDLVITPETCDDSVFKISL